MFPFGKPYPVLLFYLYSLKYFTFYRRHGSSSLKPPMLRIPRHTRVVGVRLLGICMGFAGVWCDVVETYTKNLANTNTCSFIQHRIHKHLRTRLTINATTSQQGRSKENTTHVRSR